MAPRKTSSGEESPAENTGDNKGIHPGSENLIPWQPGQSGNPGGRPKKKPITEMYERLLNDPETVIAIEAALKQALATGNMAMVLQLREMADRTEGKVSQPIDANVTMNLADAIAAGRARAAKRKV